ncbi:MAG: hypothetical protein GX552_04220, partial [Chloroflexi bacterium]|nr:hypothetical protein [Chloroflexota bacterium]
PNIFPEWGNQPVDPAAYVELLKIAYRRAKEANPNVYVLSAPLAYTLGQPHPEPGKWMSMNDLDYLEAMYEAGVQGYFDIFSVNAFGMSAPPEDPPGRDRLNFQRVLLQRKIMERHGDEDKAVWFNEYGWNAAPESFPPEKLIWGRVSEQQQAEYMLRGIQMAREEWPWAGVFMVWYFRQVGHVPLDDANYYFRMVDTDFTPRLVYFAVQDVARQEEAPGLGLYQETNPNVTIYGDWEQVIDKNALGKGSVRSDTPGDSVTFTFRGPDVDLVTRRWPGAGRLLVSLDGRPVPGLPVDEQGFSYVDLYSPLTEARARVPLVRDAVAGEHTLRLIVAEQTHVAAVGRECVLDAFEVMQEGDAAFPIWLLAGIVAGLGADGWLLWRTWRRVHWVGRAP